MDLSMVSTIDPEYQLLLIEGFKSIEDQWQQEAMSVIRKALLCGKSQDRVLAQLRKFRSQKRKEAQEKWIFENPEAYDEAVERERKKNSKYIDDEVSQGSEDEDDGDYASEESEDVPSIKRSKHSGDEGNVKKEKKSKKSKKEKKSKKKKKKKKDISESDED